MGSTAVVLSAVTVDRLQTHWEDSQTKLSDRTKQLLNMLQDSTNWLDHRKEVDRLTKEASERLESWQEITYTVDQLRRQHADLKVVILSPRIHMKQPDHQVSVKCQPLVSAGLHEGPETVAGAGDGDHGSGQQTADSVLQ